MPSYQDAIVWEEQGQGRYQKTLSPEWFQGRGAFGGVLAASILRAMILENPDPSRRPRSLTIHFCAPVVDRRAEIAVTLERAGTTVTHFRATLWQDGKPALLASSVFTQERETAFHLQHLRPWAAPPADTVEIMPSDLPFVPVFCKAFEYRYCIGSLPFSGASEALLGGYCRLVEPIPLDYPLAAALLDIWPPAVFACFDRPRTAATIDMTCHFLCDLPTTLEPHTPLVGFAETSFAADGYAEEYNYLFAPDGRPLARARQWVAILS